MNKLIFFLLVAIGVYWWLRRPRTVAQRDQAKVSPEPEAMVSCAYCGLHVPMKESVSCGGSYFCGEEHRQLGVGGRRD